MALAERTDPRLHVVDRVVRRTASVAVGAFRCPRRHPLFADTGPIENDVFVFPRTLRKRTLRLDAFHTHPPATP